ncbi:MAG: fatty acid cis/trans isomerase, partial [Halieaceae bacterium]
LASLYLVDDEEITWFRLVRSTTPPGRNLGLIATRRPYDSPGVGTFYYRLQRMEVTPLDKIHMPYRFDSERLDWYRSLFIDPDYAVTALPDYTPEVAANPFRSFQAIPVNSRYRFLLEEAQFTIMNFIKGPVCRGQIALNVIEDHFWVMFASPESDDPDSDEAFLAAETDNLRLPIVRTGTPIDLFYWRRYAKSHAAFQQAKADYLVKEMDRSDRTMNMDSIWLGDGKNPNAALTIFRHFDTASVVKGFVGGEPKTAWVIGYSLLERIHYLLVAGFDVYGPVSHQLESRLYMDFLRMEGEFNFLMFMPPAVRQELRDYWYRDARPSAAKHMFTSSDAMTRDNDIVYKTDDPKQEFLFAMQDRIHGASAANYDYRLGVSEDSVKAFAAMEQQIGAHNSYLPQVSFVNVVGEDSDEVFTLLRNSGYSNIAQLFKEEDRRLPDEDSVTVVKGFLGAYPNYFFQVNSSEVGAFVKQVGTLGSDSDYVALTKRYGVPRNAAWFWRISDKFHQRYKEQQPIESGLFDYNRYSGR